VSYESGVKAFDDAFTIIEDGLVRGSVPFSSPRYAAHMSFETSMPAIVGWILTVLFNPNNVSTTYA